MIAIVTLHLWQFCESPKRTEEMFVSYVCVHALSSRFKAVGDFVIMEQKRKRLGGLRNSTIRFFVCAATLFN